MAEDIFGTIGAELASKVFGGILWFGITAIVMVVVGSLMWYFLVYKKKFDIKVKIRSHRADDRYSTIFDIAAILYEKGTKIPYFRIWGLKRDFPVPKFEVLQSSNEGDFLEIYRKSEEEFYFLTPPEIDNNRIIRADGNLVAIADQTQTLVDPEMAFWAVKRKNTNKKMFDTESFLMKIVPFIPQIIGGVITIFVLYILMDTLPQILGSLKELAETINSNQMNRAIVTPG